MVEIYESFHIYWEMRCYATNSKATFSKNVSSLFQVPGMCNIFQLPLPQATFKASYGSFRSIQSDFHESPSMNPWKSLEMCRFATVWQIQNVNALAAQRLLFTSYFKKSPRQVPLCGRDGTRGWARKGGTSKIDDKKQCLLGTHHFLTVLAMKLCFEDLFETISEQRSLFSSVLFHPVESRRRGGGRGKKTQPVWCFSTVEKGNSNEVARML